MLRELTEWNSKQESMKWKGVCAHMWKLKHSYVFDHPVLLAHCHLNVGAGSFCNQRHCILAGYVQ